MTEKKNSCRCGFVYDSDVHPCHGKAYTCRKPAEARLIPTGPAALSGMQVKYVAYETFACDDCFELFKQLVKR